MKRRPYCRVEIAGEFRWPWRMSRARRRAPVACIGSDRSLPCCICPALRAQRGRAAALLAAEGRATPSTRLSPERSIRLRSWANCSLVDARHHGAARWAWRRRGGRSVELQHRFTTRPRRRSARRRVTSAPVGDPGVASPAGRDAGRGRRDPRVFRDVVPGGPASGGTCCGAARSASRPCSVLGYCRRRGGTGRAPGRTILICARATLVLDLPICAKYCGATMPASAG